MEAAIGFPMPVINQLAAGLDAAAQHRVGRARHDFDAIGKWFRVLEIGIADIAASDEADAKGKGAILSHRNTKLRLFVRNGTLSAKKPAVGQRGVKRRRLCRGHPGTEAHALEIG